MADWSSYPRVSLDQLQEAFGLETDDDDDPDQEVVLIEGDVRLSQSQVLAIEEQGPEALLFAVNGNVVVDGRAGGLFHVTGDIICRRMWIDPQRWRTDTVRGTVRASDSVFLDTEDEGYMWDMPACRIEAPYVFAWNCHPAGVDLNSDAVVFLLGFEPSARGLRQACFTGTDVAFVLGSRFIGRFSCENTEEKVWETRAITEALAAGRTILREGVDLASCVPVAAGHAALARGDHRAAFAQYNLAALISPSYFPALFGLGRALMDAGAYAQALGRFVAAAGHFPQEQTGLVNEALNLPAACTLRTGQAALAADLAGASIGFTRPSRWHDAPLAQAHRLRGEARLLLGENNSAERDLADALAYEPMHGNALWLMGLVHHRRGHATEALRWHTQAVQCRPALAPYYDAQANLAFAAPPPTTVDWASVLQS